VNQGAAEHEGLKAGVAALNAKALCGKEVWEYAALVTSLDSDFAFVRRTQRPQPGGDWKMAKTAVTVLTDHIESIRQEAYNEGYAAALRAVVEFSTSETAQPKTTATKATAAKPTAIKGTAAKSITATAAVPRRQRHAQAKPAPRQTQRGDNARHIAEAMMALPDHTGRAAAIKRALTKTGHDLAFTSIRHGLGQLQARGEVSLAADGKTWSYTAPAS
jgi:hypothetical protein